MIAISKTPVVEMMLALMALVLPPSTAFAQQLPAEVCATLQAERARYGTIPTPVELGKIENATAWTHRPDWGLSGKTVGNRCPAPGGQDVACDILHRRSDNLIWDVLVAAGEASTPACGEALGPMTDPSRPWIAPVDPGGGDDPTPQPTTIEQALRQLTVAIDDQSAQLLRMQDRLDTIEASLRDLDAKLTGHAASLEEHRAEGQKAMAWAKNWKNWVAVFGGVLGGLALK